MLVRRSYNQKKTLRSSNFHQDVGAQEANLYSEIAEGISSYGVTQHRHVPEIEQGLSDFAQSKVTVSFTPHLMPMIRGMQSTIYVEMAPGVKTEDLHQLLKTFYEVMTDDYSCVVRKNQYILEFPLPVNLLVHGTASPALYAPTRSGV